MQLYTSASGTRLFGLENVGDNVNDSLIATAEQSPPFTPAKVRVLLLRRNAAASLQVVQRASLNEIENGWTSFAHWPEGNLFCAVFGSSSLHKLCRSQGASETPFDNTPRVHRLPAKVTTICGLQSNGECRLAASFSDNTLRVFHVACATLCELQRVPQPDANFWVPRTLLALPGGSLILGSEFREACNIKTRYGIECCAAQQNDSLVTAKRLHVTDNNFNLIGLIPATNDYSTLRIAAFDYTKGAVDIYPLKN